MVYVYLIYKFYAKVLQFLNKIFNYFIYNLKWKISIVNGFHTTCVMKFYCTIPKEQDTINFISIIFNRGYIYILILFPSEDFEVFILNIVTHDSIVIIIPR